MQYEDVYEPAEDSFLLLKEAKKLCKGKDVLEIGTGSGIIAVGMAGTAKHVTAADISSNAVKKAKESAAMEKRKNIEFYVGDLFSCINGKKRKNKFDLIVFNPPYLPKDRGIEDLAIYGGKKGHETLSRFFDSAGEFLKERGNILVLCSTLTNPQKVEEAITRNGFIHKKICEQKLAFETLIVYLAEKSSMTRILEKKGISCIKAHMKGHRGQIFTGILANKIVAVKAWRTDIAAGNKTLHEAAMYKKLAGKISVPKIIFVEKNFFVYEFVQGEFILDFFANSSKNTIKKILADVFRQMYTLDKMGISKEEMHKPVKHIVITNEKKPFLLDFERTHQAKEPKNVTQFCQFVVSSHLSTMLKQKGFSIDRDKMIMAAQQYKKKRSNENIQKIIDLIR